MNKILLKCIYSQKFNAKNAGNQSTQQVVTLESTNMYNINANRCSLF